MEELSLKEQLAKVDREFPTCPWCGIPVSPAGIFNPDRPITDVKGRRWHRLCATTCLGNDYHLR